MSTECAVVVEKLLVQTEMGSKDEASNVRLSFYKELKAAAKESFALFVELAMIV